MNYELAKQLKDAGFPIKRVMRGFSFVDKEGLLVGGNVSHEFAERIDFILPTLSELIEACGDDFYSLVYALDNDWRCYSEAPIGEEFGLSVKTGEGAAPEEAVAKLYLALHGKTN